MYLSRIALNTESRNTLLALGSPHILHAAVEGGSKGHNQRNLWRVDWLGGICYLLVLSPNKPDFSRLFEQCGYPGSEPRWETRDYEPLLSRLKQGQVWQFRLKANPTRSGSKEWDESGRGKVFSHVTEEQQKQWLLRRSETCGFALKPEDFQVVGTKWHEFLKSNSSEGKVTLRTVVFEGVLTVRHLEHFKHALVSGIGRAKAYGCGLLTIAHYRGDSSG